jgi:hypothetical protein
LYSFSDPIRALAENSFDGLMAASSTDFLGFLLIVSKNAAPEAGFLPEGRDKLETMTGKDKPLACQI